MRKVFVLSALLCSAAFAESFTGILVDENCKGKEDLAAHTTKCAVACAKSGYGLMTADGKYLKFDTTGNEKALAALKATDKEKDLKATVNGTKEGDTLKVETVSLD